MPLPPPGRQPGSDARWAIGDFGSRSAVAKTLKPENDGKKCG
jgi:hypothetical protein